ncbi:hypothetical protein OG474_30545 [Kribbella sp. NBC_01505]|uniref:hypothetical protein n=1 Tax=Kribbella sp. NBC_01505 TaxID=2903580 RepID=UPI00386F1DAD
MPSYGYDQHPHGTTAPPHGKVKLVWPDARDAEARPVTVRYVKPNPASRRTKFPHHLMG